MVKYEELIIRDLLYIAMVLLPEAEPPVSNGDLVSLLWLTVPEIIANSFRAQQI